MKNKLKLIGLIQRMSVFTQRLNPTTGKNDWILQSENYDYKQEVARSSYADMLHDKERNDKYFEGLRSAIKMLKNQNKEVHVLDIGTGTGLLSMMALSCGVDSVTACEAFPPMASCAKNIFKLNGFDEKVNLISKRSTEVECGPGKDMERRANLLVTEVFDTELIGEGAIETYAHAKEHLLTDDALLVPSEATLYAQVVSSDLVKKWNKIIPMKEEMTPGASEDLLSVPAEVSKCPGAAAVHDIQMSQLHRDQFTAISEPIPVFKFDWSGRKIPLDKSRVTREAFECVTDGVADAVFMWWDLKMDPLGEVVLSCAPVWDHPLTKDDPAADSSKLPWRDHWMQAIYYLPNPTSVLTSERATLVSSHDDYSLWFDVSKTDNGSALTKRPVCSCGLHATTSRTRIGQLNDERRRKVYLRTLRRHVKKDTVALFCGDTSLWAIVAAKFGARHVYVSQSEGMSSKVLKEFIKNNKVEDKVTILNKSLGQVSLDDLVAPISFVFSEPYFDTSMLPWHSLQFSYLVRDTDSSLLTDDAVVLPDSLSIRAVPVQFRDLWKIRSPLGSCSGFQMEPFDQLIEEACKESDENVEPQPLWEYPCVALGQPTRLCSMSTVGLDKKVHDTVSMGVSHPGTLNGLALWVDWGFGEDTLSTGPEAPVVIGKEIEWDLHVRQGVHLFQTPLETTQPGKVRLKANTKFDPKIGNFTFDFELKEAP